jgi:hypothetical protein
MATYSVSPQTTVYPFSNVQRSSGLGVSHFQKAHGQEGLPEDSLGLMNPLLITFFLEPRKLF